MGKNVVEKSRRYPITIGCSNFHRFVMILIKSSFRMTFHFALTYDVLCRRQTVALPPEKAPGFMAYHNFRHSICVYDVINNTRYER
jgi:hypothetical protein